jgi:hypothetical protein
MRDHLLSSVRLLGRRPATGVGAGRRHLRPSVIVHGAVAVVRARLSSALIAENTWQKSEDMIKQLRSSVHLLGRVPTPSSFGIGAPAVWGRRALTCGATAPSAFGYIRRSATPENTWQKVRVWIGNFFPACISWAGCWPPISSGSAGNGLRGDPPGRGRAGWRGTRASLVAGANGWVGARGACGGRALSLSEHGLSGRGAWGLGRTLNVDRAR